MPPYSNVRRGPVASTIPQTADLDIQRRTTSGRAIRANTTRPTNYYARPYAVVQDEAEEEPPIGFFPALTFFADAIDALPKETVRQFTLLKEVDAKVHTPAGQLGELCDALMQASVPRRIGNQLATAAMMTFTAANSAAGSANASVVNGILPNVSRYGQDSAAGSTIGEDMPQETEESMERRHKYAELRQLAMTLLPNMDEKNVVLQEAIRVMNSQLSRIDGVLPYAEAEIPEEARLGSMTHWAYIKSRAPKPTTASRRDIGATNTLAAAAFAVHDSEIAQARRGDNGFAKSGRGKHRDQVDSEFEERPRKTNVKSTKARLPGAAGLGISNGEAVKRRKVEKSALPGMERQSSSMNRLPNKVIRDVPKAPLIDDRKIKPTKLQPVQGKRRGLNSAQASPAMASSPLVAQASISGQDKPQNSRNRQNSTASNLRHERLADDGSSRPSSAAGKPAALERTNPRAKRQREDNDVNGEVAKLPDEPVSKKEVSRPRPSRSNSSNNTPSGRVSGAATPQSESFPSDSTGMARSRSTRAAASTEEVAIPKGHRRGGTNGGSVSGLMRQIAPFNRSPDLDRHRKSSSGHSSSSDAAEDRVEDNEAHKSEPVSRPGSTTRRDMSVKASTEQIADEEQQSGDEPMSEMGEEAVPGLVSDNEADEDEKAQVRSPSLSPALAQPGHGAQEEEYEDQDVTLEDAGAEAEIEDEDGEDADPDDPDEPKYCYCQRGSYGDMVGCDNPKCPREWFHLDCTDLTEMPSESESWFCNFCRPKNSNTGTGNGRRGAVRGKGRAT